VFEVNKLILSLVASSLFHKYSINWRYCRVPSFLQVYLINFRNHWFWLFELKMVSWMIDHAYIIVLEFNLVMVPLCSTIHNFSTLIHA
jgi:hypothetical protein